MTRHADESRGSEQSARHADANRIERQMNPVGVRGNRHIDAIVHYQQRTRARANLPKPQRQFIKFARRQIFLAQLQRDRTGWRRGQRIFARRDKIATLHDMPISDQIKPKPDAPIFFPASHYQKSKPARP